jgi:ASC-1-like (ASCH) protein
MATRKPKTPKTSADLKKQLELAKKKIQDLEKRAYAEELTELIGGTSIVADFAKIQARVTDVKAVQILAAIGNAVGIKRLDVKQADAPKRKATDPSKPRKPRTPKTTI